MHRAIVKELVNRKGRVLVLGAGCGALPMYLGWNCKDLIVTAVDISELVLKLGRTFFGF